MSKTLSQDNPIPNNLNTYTFAFFFYCKTFDGQNQHPPFNPFELTNHAVLLIGYGVDQDTNLPYWNIKNSWGGQWGENGFFRILRGSDECGVESLAVKFDVVF
ncbi:unnamed protein product [Trichobilharzia regenti]|nr:unnamed protein product [Trichobilharzia regenti]